MDRHESKAEEERNGWGRVKTYQPGRLLMKNVQFLGMLIAQTFLDALASLDLKLSVSQ